MGPQEYSHFESRTGTPEKVLDDDIPFGVGVGKQLIVDAPDNPRGIVDVYVNEKLALRLTPQAQTITLGLKEPSY